MRKPLRHSHIAVRNSISSMAKFAGKDLVSGEDDIGPYLYFDMNVFPPRVGDVQRMRFASHIGDRMVHLLAEDIYDVSAIAKALISIGVARDSFNNISISTDVSGVPLRSKSEIEDNIISLGRDSEEKPTEREFLVSRSVKLAQRRTHFHLYLDGKFYPIENMIVSEDDVGKIAVIKGLIGVNRFVVHADLIGRSYMDLAMSIKQKRRLRWVKHFDDLRARRQRSFRRKRSRHDGKPIKLLRSKNKSK